MRRRRPGLGAHAAGFVWFGANASGPHGDAGGLSRGLNTIRPYIVNTLCAVLKRVAATCFLATAATRLRRRSIRDTPKLVA